MQRKSFVIAFVALVFVALGVGYWWHPRAVPSGPPLRIQVDSQAAGPALQDDSVSAEPGVVLVDARAAAVDQIGADLRQHVPDATLEVRPASHMDDDVMVRVHVGAGEEDEATRWLSHEDGVESAEPDYFMHAYDLPQANAGRSGPLQDPNDPLYPYLWNMHKVGAVGAWRGSTGRGAVVAVIDTGVAYEDYEGFHRVEDMRPESFVPGFNAITGSGHANDDNSHGTHVAATIAEATNNGIGAIGLAPDALIMPIKVLTRQGSGSIGGIADGIRWAADHGANIINMSLGGPIGTSALHAAVKYAAKKGVIIVCAAGNSGNTAVGYPAMYPECIAVSSIRFDNQLAFYSCRGKRIDIAAPGGDTTVDQNNDGYPDGILQNTIERENPAKEGYFMYQGTSMASPHVAAAAALIVSLGITNPKAVKEVLQKSAFKKGLDLPKGYGAGVLDANKAVATAVLGIGVARLFLGLLLMATVLRLASGGLYAQFSPFTIVGLVAGSCGLFFLPYVMTAPAPAAEFLCRPLPQWDMALFGLAGHANPLFYSAIIPALFGIPFGRLNRYLTHLLTGLSAGVGACLLHEAFTSEARLQFVPNFLDLPMIWLVINAALCVFLAIGLADARARTAK